MAVLEHPNTAMEEIPWYDNTVFLPQTVTILQVPIQLRLHTTWQATTKILLLQKTFNEHMRKKSACVNWLEKYNYYISWNLHFLEEKS